MWIKVTYAFNGMEVYVDLDKAWRIKEAKHGSTIYFNHFTKDERQISVKETPLQLFVLATITLNGEKDAKS